MKLASLQMSHPDDIAILLECVHARPLMASARPRKHSLAYVSAAAERRDDGIEHTVVYKLLGLDGACASHSI